MASQRYPDFDEFMETIYVEMMREVPELSMLMGVLTVGSIGCALDRFSLMTDEAIADRLRVLRSIERRLAAFPRDCMSPSQLISADVLDHFVNFACEGPWIGLKGADFASHAYLVNPGYGEPTRLLDALTQQHPFRHAQDAEDYLRRVEVLGDSLAHVAQQVAQRARRGILLPAELLRQSIEEIRGLLALSAQDHPIRRTFVAKSASIAGLDARRRRQLLAALEDAVQRRVLPAYAALRERLEGHLKEASVQPGLWQLPDGEAYYEFLLRAATTAEWSAADVHELGVDHVTRLQAQIVASLKAAGLPSSDMLGSLRQLESETRFAPSVERRALLERCRTILSEVHGRLPQLFHRVPAAAIEIEPVPAFSEAARHTTYQPSAADGSRPACMLINLRDVAAESELDLPTLLYHEVYPGHHLQLSYAQQLRGLPTFRRTVTFDAYIEGWAKYAETIPWEHDINRDPRWHAMRLRRELLSTANLVLDTGIHSKRWTLDAAASYLCATTGCSGAMGRAIALRSASMPAQLCSYKIGMLQMTDLKDKFQRARGASFDIRDFHSAVLENGALPMRVLNAVVENAMARPRGYGPA